ncbi:MAG: hypothetical protein R2710_26290, partial [Acidimicrobiales bacterium]
MNEAAGIDRTQLAGLEAALCGVGVTPDLFVLDGLRVAATLSHIDAPALVDLDDLLSVRYRAWASLPFAELPFDIFGTNPSSPVNGLARRLRPLLPHVLRHEARAAERFELDVCASGARLSLVNPVEAAALSQRIGRIVDTLPMALPSLPSATWLYRCDPRFDAAFVGRVTHLSNLASLHWFAQEVLPELRRLLGRAPRIAVVGRTSATVERWLRSIGLEPLGFVPDLAD